MITNTSLIRTQTFSEFFNGNNGVELVSAMNLFCEALYDNVSYTSEVISCSYWYNDTAAKYEGVVTYKRYEINTDNTPT